MDYAKESLKRHGQWKGKIEVVSTVPVSNREELTQRHNLAAAEAARRSGVSRI